MDAATIARKVRLLRDARQMTQGDLADAIGRHKITIARLEAGKNVARSVLLSVADVLNIPHSDLIDDGEVEGLDDVQVTRNTSAQGNYTRVPIYPRADLLDSGPTGDPVSTITVPTSLFYPTPTRTIDTSRLFATEGTEEMTPNIMPGDIVVVEEGAQARGGGIGLYATPDGPMFRLYPRAISEEPPLHRPGGGDLPPPLASHHSGGEERFQQGPARGDNGDGDGGLQNVLQLLLPEIDPRQGKPGFRVFVRLLPQEAKGLGDVLGEGVGAASGFQPIHLHQLGFHPANPTEQLLKGLRVLGGAPVGDQRVEVLHSFLQILRGAHEVCPHIHGGPVVPSQGDEVVPEHVGHPFQHPLDGLDVLLEPECFFTQSVVVAFTRFLGRHR